MAFADSQTVTIDGTAIALSRHFTGTTVGLFASEDGNTSMEVTPAASKGRRHRVARLRQKKTTADPLVGTVNVRVDDYMSFNINLPAEGYSNAEVLKQATGFLGWLTANSNANLIKLIAGEN